MTYRKHTNYVQQAPALEGKSSRSVTFLLFPTSP